MNVRRWLAAAQARADAATPGPWDGHDPGHDGKQRPLGTLSLATGDPVVAYDWGITNRPDADFIAAARTDLPAALAAIRGVLEIADSLATAPGITDRATLAAALHGTLAGALLPTDGDHRG